MKILVRHDGSVSIEINDQHYQYLAPPQKWWVTEFEIDGDDIVNVTRRKPV
jgi:hypothetical protein